MTMVWPTSKLGMVLQPVARETVVDPSKEYRLLGVRLDGAGPFHRETVLGSQTSAKKLYEVREGDFIYSRLFAWRGAFGIVDRTLDGHFVSNEFPTFRPIADQIDPKFLRYWFRVREVLKRVEADCTGSTPLTRNRYKEEFFCALEIALPSAREQRRIVATVEELAGKIDKARELRNVATKEIEALEKSATDRTFRHLAAEHGVVTLAGACISLTDGAHLTPAFSQSGPKFIFVGNVSSGFLHFKGAKCVAQDYFDGLSMSFGMQF
jgi:hypothetical protein